MTMANRRLFLSSAAAVAAFHPPLLFGSDSGPSDSGAVSPVRYRRLTLQSQQLDAMRRFYIQDLGFELSDSSDHSFTLRAGDSEIEFQQAPAGANPFYHFAFSIAENKIEAAKRWTEHRTVVLTRPSTGNQIIHFRTWNARAIYFRDPAGNIAEFIAHHSMPTSRDGEFSLADVLHVSEVGLVAADVRAAVAEIEPLLGVTDTPAVSANFAAVGDAIGFLIVVRQNRIWLPTKDVRARPYPVTAEIGSRLPGPAALECGPYRLRRFTA